MFLSCAHPPRSPSSGASPPGPGPSDFSRLVDAYFEAKLTFEPTTATALGLHAHDRALEDLSRGRIAARVAEVRAFVARLDALPPRASRPTTPSTAPS